MTIRLACIKIPQDTPRENTIKIDERKTFMKKKMTGTKVRTWKIKNVFMHRLNSDTS